jgi:hypothetical protein
VNIKNGKKDADPATRMFAARFFDDFHDPAVRGRNDAFGIGRGRSLGVSKKEQHKDAQKQQHATNPGPMKRQRDGAQQYGSGGKLIPVLYHAHPWQQENGYTPAVSADILSHLE